MDTMTNRIFLSALASDVKFYTGTIEDLKEKLSKNFNYHMQWGAGKDLFIANYKQAILFEIYNFYATEEQVPNEAMTIENVVKHLKNLIRRIEEKLLDSNLYNRSTSTESNLCDDYTITAQQELRKIYIEYINEYLS